MQFKVNDYIFYGTDGICQIDAVCENPFEGAPEGVCYYVLHTVKEPRQTIWNPVLNDRVLMRYLLNADELDELLLSLPYAEPFSAPNAKLLREKYLGAIKSGMPSEWCRVIRTYTCRCAVSDGSVRVTDAEKGFFDSARALLAAEIAMATGLSTDDADAKILEIAK